MPILLGPVLRVSWLELPWLHGLVEHSLQGDDPSATRRANIDFETASRKPSGSAPTKTRYEERTSVVASCRWLGTDDPRATERLTGLPAFLLRKPKCKDLRSCGLVEPSGP